jgi:hypothetical protein
MPLVNPAAQLATAVLFVLLALPAFAQVQQTLFGPKQYDHPIAGPSRAADAVAVPDNFTGPFMLRIRSGAAEERINAGWVYLNGVQIVGPADLQPQVSELERSVPLQASNELVVVIRGRAGTRLSLSISGQRKPALPTALAPDPLTLITGKSGTLTATLSPPPAVAGALSVASDDASVASVPPSVAFAAEQTLVTIPVTAGTVGNTRVSASLNGRPVSAAVRVLPEPPRIDAIAPASGAPGTLVTLSGVFFDPVPANNHVLFAGAGDAQEAAVIAASASQVTVRVPQLAVSGPITLTDSRGTAQSAPFMLLPLAARFDLTRAGMTARSVSPGSPVNPSSPVTPFVKGADPGDAFSLEVLAQPATGTASLNGNKLAYQPNQSIPAFSGVDQFPYRVLAADGSSVDGTALVRVYNPGNFNRCTARSVPAQRINVLNCSFYGEAVTRTTAGGAPVTVQYIALRPSNGSAPKAAVFLIGGGDFDLNFAGNAATGMATTIGGNFLVRTAQIFAEAGYLAIAMNKPSDQPPAGSTNTIVDADRYRISVNHAVDILALLREVNTDRLDVFLAGTSRGAISAVAANLIAAGISLSSPVTRGSIGPGPLFVNDPRHSNLQPSFVQRPAHVLWHTLDQCPLTRPADSQTLAGALGAAFNSVTGGFINDPDICGAQHFHGFMGIEPEAVLPVTDWLDGRVAALAGNKRPAAAFAELTVASGASLAIDLAALTSDADGDALSYALSHVGSSLGGTVALDGATVTYTPPAAAANVTDRFVYVVTDGRGGVSAAVISIKIGG